MIQMITFIHLTPEADGLDPDFDLGSWVSTIMLPVALKPG